MNSTLFYYPCVCRLGGPLFLAAILFNGTSLFAQNDRLWSLSPYRIKILVAARTQSVAPDRLAIQVAERLEERASATIGALWDLEISVVEDAERDALLQVIHSRGASLVDLASSSFDKIIGVILFEEVDRTRVLAIERDELLQYLGTPQERTLADFTEAGDAAFSLACEVFSPLASYRVNREDPNQVDLTFKGNLLPKKPGSPEWVREQDVLLPFFRRTDRDGVLVPEGVQRVPWTYLKVLNQEEAPTAEVMSHTRRPFGVRRRGRVDQLALRLPRCRSETMLRLHSRDDENTPLAGYQAFVQDGPDGEKTPLGVSDSAGLLHIGPGDWPVRMIYLKSGAQLVAKLPVVPGAQAQLNVPLLDERKRLEAEAKLGRLREELIDLVARRSILAARIDAAIEEKEFDEARRLLRELESYPGRAIFDRKLTSQEERFKTSDPIVQKRITQIFEDTRGVLGAFLNTREIRDLHKRLADAQEN